MDRSPQSHLVVAFLTLLLLPAAATAQVGEETPQQRFIVMTTFDVPINERQAVGQYYQRVLIPQARMNPNVLSYRLASHNWGSNANQIVVLTEYDSWEAIQAPCEECQAWYDEQFPEDSEARAEVEELRDEWMRYYTDHRDEIYATSSRWSKGF